MRARVASQDRFTFRAHNARGPRSWLCNVTVLEQVAISGWRKLQLSSRLFTRTVPRKRVSREGKSPRMRIPGISRCENYYSLYLSNLACARTTDILHRSMPRHFSWHEHDYDIRPNMRRLRAEGHDTRINKCATGQTGSPAAARIILDRARCTCCGATARSRDCATCVCI